MPCSYCVSGTARHALGSLDSLALDLQLPLPLGVHLLDRRILIGRSGDVLIVRRRRIVRYGIFLRVFRRRSGSGCFGGRSVISRGGRQLNAEERQGDNN